MAEVPIGLYHPLDGITNPKNKLLCFFTTNFLKREEGTSLFMAVSLPLSKTVKVNNQC
jgi:hypothetical protein